MGRSELEASGCGHGCFLFNSKSKYLSDIYVRNLSSSNSVCQSSLHEGLQETFLLCSVTFRPLQTLGQASFCSGSFLFKISTMSSDNEDNLVLYFAEDEIEAHKAAMQRVNEEEKKKQDAINDKKMKAYRNAGDNFKITDQIRYQREAFKAQEDSEGETGRDAEGL